jgi:hypothetical protein
MKTEERESSLVVQRLWDASGRDLHERMSTDECLSMILARSAAGLFAIAGRQAVECVIEDVLAELERQGISEH